MTVSDLWEGATLLEQQIDTRKLGKFILNLETRLEAAERRIEQHALTIEQCRQEAASKSAILKRRISGLERLLKFLADILVALIALIAGGVIAAYLGSNQLLPSIVVAVFSFGLAFLGTHFFSNRWKAGALNISHPQLTKTRLPPAPIVLSIHLDRQYVGRLCGLIKNIMPDLACSSPTGRKPVSLSRPLNCQRAPFRRRALSRRKFAIRDFDAAWRQQVRNKEATATSV